MEGNLSAYRIFHRVALHGSISYAARDLFISQPAVSKAVSRLEENLGMQLFYRSSKGVVLTDEGRILFDRIDRALALVEEGEEQVQRMKKLGVGQIHIGASHTLCKYILLPYLKKFVEEYPHIKISISCQSTYHTVKLLEEEKIDIGLIGKSGYGKDLEFFGIQWIEDIFVANPRYLENLQVREAASASGILKKSYLMLLEEENITRRYVDCYLKEQDIQPNQVLEAESMDLLIDFAKIGIGMACVIREFVKNELQSQELMEIPLPCPMEKRQVGFACRSKRNRSRAEEQFMDFVHREKPCSHLPAVNHI